MKNYVTFFCMVFMLFMFSQSAFSQVVLPGDDMSGLFDLSSLSAIIALASFIVTQIAKSVPIINEKAVFKIITSIIVGTLLTLIAWKSNLAPFLENMQFWQVLIQGLISGGAASGLYDFLKSIGLLGNKKKT